ncbi:MAG: Ku protein [Acidobacteria bacterium]|nr:Ku protein [Acidobacteriota bacterium]
MGARAVWKGTIQFGSTRLPVKLYSAVQDRNIHFHLLHRPDRERIKQRMVNPVSGREVPREEIRRGYEVEPGLFVLLDDEELAELDPRDSRTIDVAAFLPASAIDHRWYERPYYLGPDGGGETNYFALAAALQKTRKEGLARWVMRKTRYAGALRAHGGHLMLVTLRPAQEVVPVSALEAPAGRALDAREKRMAEQLVDALGGPFDPAEFRDEYRDRVMELVQAKAKGRKVKTRRAPRRKQPGTLAAALEASLRAAGKAASVKTRRRAHG